MSAPSGPSSTRLPSYIRSSTARWFTIQSLRIVKATPRLSEGTTTTFQWDGRRGWVDQYGEEVDAEDIGLPFSIETKGNYEVPIVFEWDEQIDMYKGTIIGEEEAQIAMEMAVMKAAIFQPWTSIPVSS